MLFPVHAPLINPWSSGHDFCSFPNSFPSPPSHTLLLRSFYLDRTPDLSGVLNEVIASSSWVSGSPLTVRFSLNSINEALFSTLTLGGVQAADWNVELVIEYKSSKKEQDLFAASLCCCSDFAHHALLTRLPSLYMKFALRWVLQSNSRHRILTWCR